MTKTLTKHGNSLALVIERSILELLNIRPDTPLNVTTDGQALIVAHATSLKLCARPVPTLNTPEISG